MYFARGVNWLGRHRLVIAVVILGLMVAIALGVVFFSRQTQQSNASEFSETYVADHPVEAGLFEQYNVGSRTLTVTVAGKTATVHVTQEALWARGSRYDAIDPASIARGTQLYITYNAKSGGEAETIWVP